MDSTACRSQEEEEEEEKEEEEADGKTKEAQRAARECNEDGRGCG